MKKIIILLIALMAFIPLILFYFSNNKITETGSLPQKVKTIEETTKVNMEKEKDHEWGNAPSPIIKDRPPRVDLTPAEKRGALKDLAEEKRERAFKLKENLEWLKEDIDIEYINKKEKTVAPFNTIRESEVGWDIQTIDVIENYNIEKINNYIPVQFKIEQMAKGGFKGEIESVEVFSPSGKRKVFYLNQRHVKISPDNEEINILYFASDSAYGKMAITGGTKRGFSGYIDHIDLDGKHLIELNKEGRGYVYSIHP